MESTAEAVESDLTAQGPLHCEVPHPPSDEAPVRTCILHLKSRVKSTKGKTEDVMPFCDASWTKVQKSAQGRRQKLNFPTSTYYSITKNLTNKTGWVSHRADELARVTEEATSKDAEAFSQICEYTEQSVIMNKRPELKTSVRSLPGIFKYRIKIQNPADKKLGNIIKLIALLKVLSEMFMITLQQMRDLSQEQLC